MTKPKTQALSEIAPRLPEYLSFHRFYSAYLRAVAEGQVLAIPIESTFQHHSKTIKDDLILITPQYTHWYDTLCTHARLAHQRKGLVVERTQAESGALNLEELAHQYQRQIKNRKTVNAIKPKGGKTKPSKPKLPPTRPDLAQEPKPAEGSAAD